MVKNPPALMRANNCTDFVRTNWMWAAKTVLLNKNKRCKSKISISKLMKLSIQIAFFFYKFFILLPNKHANSDNNISNWSTFSQNAEYFLFFQHNHLVSHLSSLKLKKNSWMGANKKINAQIYQQLYLKAGKV